MYLHELPELYQVMYHTELDPISLGYASMCDLAFAIRDDVISRVEHVNSTKMLLHPIKDKKEMEVRQLDCRRWGNFY